VTGEEKGVAETFIFMCANGEDDLERMILPLVGANTAAIAGQRSIVFCTMDGVRIGTRGGVDGLALEGFPNPETLLPEFVGNDGEIWLCQTCARPRGITEDMLVDGAKIVGAAKLVEEILGGAKPVTLA
jgi:predicted peroxiredoxin